MQALRRESLPMRQHFLPLTAVGGVAVTVVGDTEVCVAISPQVLFSTTFLTSARLSKVGVYT